METALAALAEESDIDFGRNRRSRDTTDSQRVTTVAWRTPGEPRSQTRDRAPQWRETIPR